MIKHLTHYNPHNSHLKLGILMTQHNPIQPINVRWIRFKFKLWVKFITPTDPYVKSLVLRIWSFYWIASNSEFCREVIHFLFLIKLDEMLFLNSQSQEKKLYSCYIIFSLLPMDRGFDFEFYYDMKGFKSAKNK